MSLRKVNQSDLAKSTGLSVTTISRYLSGESELRSGALVKVFAALGADLDQLMKKEINKALGSELDGSIGEDIGFLLENSSPIKRKTVAQTLISNFKDEKNPDTKNRIIRLKRYRDAIKTVRRVSC